jgi:3-oxoacyl-[acyl-carrier protein] reductase
MKTNRVVVITGAAGGIGTELVRRFLENGDMVIATDLKDEGLQKLKTSTGHTSLLTVAANLTDFNDCERLSEIARASGGSVDVLINCAGYFPIHSFEEISPEEWREIIDVNLTGPFLVTRALLPLMKVRGWGRVINFGSASVFEGVAGQSHYVAAKAGIVGLSRSIAREFGQYGITVNIVTPGLTLTPNVKKSFPKELLDGQRSSRAIQRDEQPQDLVGAVFFLASPDADFISGQTVNVDGGRNMQ